MGLDSNRYMKPPRGEEELPALHLQTGRVSFSHKIFPKWNPNRPLKVQKKYKKK
jgi:hypothetical protein